uniref:Zgc:171971 n=1 Tax=Myripristis murdjan TaxID=586833 RepID=A0A668AJ80_9TELE
MTDPGDADCVAGSSGVSSGVVLSFPPGRGLPGRSRGLSSPPPPGRLTSLRSRDLTLGAFKKSKVNSGWVLEETHMPPKKERREREERRREMRGRRRERPQTIQSHSIFEQGPADTIRKTGSHTWRGATDVCDTTASSVCKFVKKERRESEEDEDEILSKLQRDDFIDDPGLRNDSKLRPIQLPLCHSSSFLKTEATLKTPVPGDKLFVVVVTGKEEPPLFRSPSSVVPGRGLQSGPEQPSLVQLFQELSLSGQEELFFIQLPDCMPGRASGPVKADTGVSSVTEKPAKKDSKADDKRAVHLKAQEAAVKEDCPVLSDFPEGFLGKLQIRRSGKVELKLGDVVMDVSEGAAFSFLQQLVSVRLSDGRTGDMTVLGNVHHKLVLSPDFQALLQVHK